MACRRSGCNAATTPCEKLSYDSLDKLLLLSRAMGESVGRGLSLWKADVDAAFRRVPLDPYHREYAWVAFKRDGEIYVAQHLGMPFGAMASVHNWERIGVPSCAYALCPRVR